MNNDLLASKFLTELREAARITADRAPSKSMTVPAVADVVEAMIARYRRLHPDIFTVHMNAECRWSCQCGECEVQGVLIVFNRPLSVLLGVDNYGPQ